MLWYVGRGYWVAVVQAETAAAASARGLELWEKHEGGTAAEWDRKHVLVRPGEEDDAVIVGWV